MCRLCYMQSFFYILFEWFVFLLTFTFSLLVGKWPMLELDTCWTYIFWHLLENCYWRFHKIVSKNNTFSEIIWKYTLCGVYLHAPLTACWCTNWSPRVQGSPRANSTQRYRLLHCHLSWDLSHFRLDLSNQGRYP